MADNGIGDYFISDIDDEMLEEEDELISAPVVVPGNAQPQQPAAAQAEPGYRSRPHLSTAPAEPCRQNPSQLPHLRRPNLRRARPQSHRATSQSRGASRCGTR